MPTPMHVFARVASSYDSTVDPADSVAVDNFFGVVLPTLSAHEQQEILSELVSAEGEERDLERSPRRSYSSGFSIPSLASALQGAVSASTQTLAASECLAERISGRESLVADSNLLARLLFAEFATGANWLARSQTLQVVLAPDQAGEVRSALESSFDTLVADWHGLVRALWRSAQGVEALFLGEVGAHVAEEPRGLKRIQFDRRELDCFATSRMSTWEVWKAPCSPQVSQPPLRLWETVQWLLREGRKVFFATQEETFLANGRLRPELRAGAGERLVLVAGAHAAGNREEPSVPLLGLKRFASLAGRFAFEEPQAAFAECILCGELPVLESMTCLGCGDSFPGEGMNTEGIIDSAVGRRIADGTNFVTCKTCSGEEFELEFDALCAYCRDQRAKNLAD